MKPARKGSRPLSKALDALLRVQTQAVFASVVRSLPPPVEFTPPARWHQEPFEISASMGEVRLEGRWQVGRLTKIDTGMGSVTIDLSQAEFDDWAFFAAYRGSLKAFHVFRR